MFQSKKSGRHWDHSKDVQRKQSFSDIQAPERTIGARKTPSLKFLVSSLTRFEGLGEKEVDRRDMKMDVGKRTKGRVMFIQKGNK